MRGFRSRSKAIAPSALRSMDEYIAACRPFAWARRSHGADIGRHALNADTRGIAFIQKKR